MKYEELIDFLEHKMSMSHVYQPLLVRALVDAGGAATLRQLAQVFLSQDESQLLYYEKRIKEMPLKVLKRHGVVASDGQLVSLSTGDLTLEQKAHIRMLCEHRLQSFVQKRGIGIWDYRLFDEEPIPDSLRYLVLKAAGGRCQLCGIAAKERPLDVDHIIPRSRGGKTELANLQALCSKCNRSKRNQDDTDFRPWPLPSADATCVFCQSAIVSEAVEKNGSVFAIHATAGTSRVAHGPHCLHAVATTPAGRMEFVRSYNSIRFGLPSTRGGSAPALTVSGPARRSLTLRPARSPSRLATLCTRGFSSLVASTAALIATGWSEPVPGRVYPRCGPAPSRRTRVTHLLLI